MMMMKLYSYRLICAVLLTAGLSVIVSSCKKEEEKPSAPARIFKPGGIRVSAGQTSAMLTWTRPLLSTGKALTYTVDFAKDSTFNTVAFSATTDSTEYTITDDQIEIRTRYYVRVKANALDQQPESKYLYGSGFSLSGLQLFKTLQDNEVKDNSVTLRFVNTAGLSGIVLTPATGAAVNVTLSAADLTAELKSITGLAPGTRYVAELFAGTKSKGQLNFTTLAATNYTQVISPSDALTSIIADAANGSIIGLNPGTYDLTAAVTVIRQKTITLKSISGNPKDTKVNYKQFDIEGTGAGLTLSGIELDGIPGAAPYFINFIGSQSANGNAATFTSVIVDNCIVHDATTAFMRGNRGSAVGDHKINSIVVNNSIVYNMGANASSSYYAFHFDNMEFKTLNVTKSTFYNFGPGLVLASKTFTADAVPTVTISQSTFNSFGGSSKYALLDAAANAVNFTVRNSIMANTPRSGSINAAAIRATAAGITLGISYSNYFNLNSTSGGTTALTFASATLTNNQTIVLPWTEATTDFSLPVGSPLRSAASDSGPVGDPRWTY